MNPHVSPRRARKLLLAGALVIAGMLPAGLRALPVHAADCSAWMDTSKTPDQRAHALLAAMTQSDKLALTQDQGLIWSHYGVAGYIASPDTSLCIPDLVLNDAGQGVGDQMTGTTAFPAPISQASSWDPAAQQTFGAALGHQAWSKGINVQLAPGIETDRTLLNGRNWEYMSEDPFLAGQTAAAVTRGIQSANVVATLKHYIANSQESIRSGGSSDLDERTLHEIYMPPYETAIQQGGAGAIMCSYNRINGVYSCQNQDTLLTALRQQLGFTGFVMSDWGAQHSTVASAEASLDMEMGSSTYYGATLGTAITNGQVSQATLDSMVLHILNAMFSVGLFDHPIAMGAAAQTQAAATPTDTPDQNTLAGQIEEQGAVLLKDASNVLPIVSSPTSPQRVAVIGQVAGPQGATEAYNGGGSGHIPEIGTKADIVDPVAGMEAFAASHANGAVIDYADGSAPGFADAIAAATAANVAVVFVNDCKAEGGDQSSMALPPAGTGSNAGLTCTTGSGYNQDQLISAVAGANPNTVVVLETGQPVTMPWLNQVKGVLEAWYPGQDEGDAIAALLFGAVTPSGHLTETWPLSLSPGDFPQSVLASKYTTQANQDCAAIGAAPPCSSPHSAYTEGLNVGYRWYDDTGAPVQFPFGYGLSYTSFGYSNYQLVSGPKPGQATVSFDVTNTGQRAGATVAQVYVGSPANNYVEEPLHQLRGYQKTQVLNPNQVQHISIPLDSRSVSYWDTTSNSWQPENGCHPVWVGGSSRDIELQGSGLDGGMQVVSDCAASVSTFAFANPAQVPEAPSGVALLLIPGLAALAGGVARRRSRRSAMR